MTKEQKEYVRATIENEGFDYALCDYSDFDEIEDPMFHSILRLYREAKSAMEEYIG
jgi:hypothetical protein